MSLKENSNNPAVPAIEGNAAKGGDGVLGVGRRGVVGRSETYQGVYGWSRDNAGLVGESQDFDALFAISHSANNGGVFGTNDAGGAGVIGEAASGDGVSGHGRRGVVGRSETYQGVYGWSRDNAGVVGESEKFHAVFGISRDPNNAGIFGANTAGGWAGIFDGRISVLGNIEFPGRADVAEEFDVEDDVEVLPGQVVRLGRAGGLRPAKHAYDTSVVGIVTGAPGYQPALVLDRQATGRRAPIALVGKVMCWVDAGPASVRPGDPLTTSTTPGHAMRATDRRRAVGALVGKALDGLDCGRSLLPVLVMLR